MKEDSLSDYKDLIPIFDNDPKDSHHVKMSLYVIEPIAKEDINSYHQTSRW